MARRREEVRLTARHAPGRRARLHRRTHPGTNGGDHGIAAIMAKQRSRVSGLARCPLPVVSSARITSPGPTSRVRPSLVVMRARPESMSTHRLPGATCVCHAEASGGDSTNVMLVQAWGVDASSGGTPSPVGGIPAGKVTSTIRVEAIGSPRFSDEKTAAGKSSSRLRHSVTLIRRLRRTFGPMRPLAHGAFGTSSLSPRLVRE